MEAYNHAFFSTAIPDDLQAGIRSAQVEGGHTDMGGYNAEDPQTPSKGIHSPVTTAARQAVDLDLGTPGVADPPPDDGWSYGHVFEFAGRRIAKNSPVQANRRSGGTWLDGVVVFANKDGTYDIKYDVARFKEEGDVPLERLRFDPSAVTFKAPKEAPPTEAAPVAPAPTTKEAAAEAEPEPEILTRGEIEVLLPKLEETQARRFNADRALKIRQLKMDLNAIRINEASPFFSAGAAKQNTGPEEGDGASEGDTAMKKLKEEVAELREMQARKNHPARAARLEKLEGELRSMGVEP